MDNKEKYNQTNKSTKDTKYNIENQRLSNTNKLIIDTRTKFSIRQTRVSSTKDSSVTLESKKVKKAKSSTKLKSIEDQNS